MGAIRKALGRRFGNARERRRFLTGIAQGLDRGRWHGPRDTLDRQLFTVILKRLHETSRDPAELAEVEQLQARMQAAAAGGSPPMPPEGEGTADVLDAIRALSSDELS
jgi:hypothetical protein